MTYINRQREIGLINVLVSSDQGPGHSYKINIIIVLLSDNKFNYFFSISEVALITTYFSFQTCGLPETLNKVGTALYKQQLRVPFPVLAGMVLHN